MIIHLGRSVPPEWRERVETMAQTIVAALGLAAPDRWDTISIGTWSRRASGNIEVQWEVHNAIIKLARHLVEENNEQEIYLTLVHEISHLLDWPARIALDDLSSHVSEARRRRAWRTANRDYEHAHNAVALVLARLIPWSAKP